MYFPILTLRTSGMPRCRMASRTALPWGSNTADFGMTMTFAFTSTSYPPKDGFVQWRIWARPANKRFKTGLLQDNDVQHSLAAQDIDPHISFVVPGQQKVHTRVSYLQSADRHLLEKTR
jgi:hypothetical protein